MNLLNKFLSIIDKISITVFICCLSYMGYVNGKYVLSFITLLIAFVYFICLCKYYRNKPFGNKVLDVFAITMCIIGFAYSEDPTLIGCITLIAALIDLVYFWFIYYCDKKQGCN